MSHLKYARLAGEQDGELLVQAVMPGSTVAAPNLTASVRDFIRTLTPDPRYTYALVNAMGYSEFYGSNSNTDWYGYNPHLDFNGLLHVPEGFGRDIEKDQMQGKDWPYGYPTFYGATAYAHHKNTDPQQLGFGDVIYAGINPKMKRVELVKRIFNEEAIKKGHQSILDRMRNGERVDVSMGCFQAGAQITMADGTRKPIEQVEVGDRVLTHTGEASRVTELHRRTYKGTFYAIRPANEDVMYATCEHPFWVARERDVRAHGVWIDGAQPEMRWEYAKRLDSAVLSHPAVSRTVEPAGITPAHARILGYYLAEGHITRDKLKRWNGVEFTVNEADRINAELPGLCESLGTRNAPNWRQRVNSKAAWSIHICDPALAEFCAKYAGRYSKTKKLAEEVLYWPEDLQYELLGAYFEGDGCGHAANGTLSASTSSGGLAHQLRLILHRLGLPASWQRLEHKPSGKAKKPTTEWVVFLGRQWAAKLAPYCSKVAPVEVRRTKNAVKRYGDYWLIPVREYEEFEAEAEVYNFEVEGDNSYIVNGVAAHNCKIPFDLCSICTDWDTVRRAWKTYDPRLHKHPGIAILAYHKTVSPIRGLAITKDDYCRCMKEMRGKILPDGRKVFVYNDFPRFFDISFVWIGADRTARVMWHLMPDVLPKVTGPVAAAAVDPKTKLLEILAKLLATKTASKKLSEMEKEVPGGIAQAVMLASDQEPALSADALMPLSSRYGAKGLLSSLAALGIVLKPEEFGAVVTPEDPDLSRHVMATGQIPTFSTQAASIDDRFAVDPACCFSDLMSQCAGLAPARSSFAPFLMPRVTRIVIAKTASSPPRIDASPLAEKLASQYTGYRLSVLENAAEIFGHGAHHLDSIPGIHEKTANEGLALLLLGLAPVIHLLAAHLREKALAGSELGAVGRFVAENPSFTAVSTIGAGLRAAMGIQQAGGILPAAKTLITAAKAML